MKASTDNSRKSLTISSVTVLGGDKSKTSDQEQVKVQVRIAECHVKEKV